MEGDVMAKAKERTAGFAIDCGDDRTIADAAHEAFVEHESIKELAVDAGYMTSAGEITKAGWEQLSKDVMQIERNCLAWLKKSFPNGVRDEGHDSRDDLVGTLWWNPRSKKQRELLELGRDERIDFVDSSYGDLYKTVYDKTSGFSTVIYGSITFFAIEGLEE
jgi:hypothetical protein